jgi:hypothetical protein
VDGKVDEVTANALFAAVEGVRPENEVEGMLAVEMALRIILRSRPSRRGVGG